jgi:predicted TIM-barrel fold metal-dependent hydrolase
MFSVGYPYQSAQAATWFLVTIELEPSAKEAVTSGNVARLLNSAGELHLKGDGRH